MSGYRVYMRDGTFVVFSDLLRAKRFLDLRSHGSRLCRESDGAVLAVKPVFTEEQNARMAELFRQND